MAVHVELSRDQAADRLVLRELFDAYAHCADRRDAEGQKALFTDDTESNVDGHLYFAERKLILDWSETRLMTAVPAA